VLIRLIRSVCVLSFFFDSKLRVFGLRAIFFRRAGVAELVDAQDLKSCAFRGVRVRFPPSAPIIFPTNLILGMKKALRILLLFSSASVCAFAQNGKNFVAADGGFKLDLPSAYKSHRSDKMTQPVPGIDGAGATYTWESYPFLYASASYFLLTKSKGALTAADRMKMTAVFKAQMVASVKTSGVAMTESLFSFRGGPGFELHLAYPGRKGRMRVFSAGRRLYCLTMIYPDSLDEAQFVAVLDSFTLLSSDELVAAKIAEATPKDLQQSPRVPKASSDAADDRLKGKVSSVTEESEQPKVKRERSGETYYDEDGQRLKSVQFQEGYPQMVEAWGYLDGKRVSAVGDIIAFDDDQRPPLRNKYLVEDFSPDAPPEIPSGMPVSGPSSVVFSYEYKYDDNKRQIERRCYAPNGKLSSSTAYKYLPGKIEKIEYDSGGVEMSHSFDVLDSNDNVIEEYSLDDKNRPIDRHLHKYEFDTRGNWIVQRTYENRTVKGRPVTKLLWTTYRTIVYYS
jgi:hypothetical protein